MKKWILLLAIVAAVSSFFLLEKFLALRAMTAALQKQQTALMASTAKAVYWHAYEERLLKIDVSGCPADFWENWTNYVQAVHVTAGMQGINIKDAMSLASPKSAMLKMIVTQSEFKVAQLKIKEAKSQLVGIAQRRGASLPPPFPYPALADF
jgi:hypothetical protein